MPVCTKCGASKDRSEFYRNKLVASGITPDCKECRKAGVRRYREANIEKIRVYDRKRGQLDHRKAAVKMRAHRYKQKHAAWTRRYHDENPEKRAARIATGNAIRDGKLTVRPCERCGDGVGVEAHHEDYSKPLDVTWLCPSCHGARHREMNDEQRRASR